MISPSSYLKVGEKNIGTVFLLTDAQVAEQTTDLPRPHQ